MLMMQGDFVAGSANIDNLDEHAAGLPILLETKDKQLNRVMSQQLWLWRHQRHIGNGTLQWLVLTSLKKGDLGRLFLYALKTNSQKTRS